MPQHLQDVDVEFVSLVDRAAVRDPQNKSEPRRFLFWKSAGHTTPQGDQMTPEEMKAAVEKAEADAKAAQEKAEADVQAAKEAQEKAESERDEALEKAAKKTGDTDDEDGEGKNETTKADLPPEVVARIEKAEADAKARIEKAEKDAAEAQAIAKAEQDRRVTGEYIAKAEELPHLPQQPSEFGVVLKHAAETLAKEDFEYIESLLKAANEQISKGKLFDAVGTDVGGSRVPTDAYAEVQRKAQELVKSDGRMSLGEAEAKVMKDDPELQARYLASVRP